MCRESYRSFYSFLSRTSGRNSSQAAQGNTLLIITELARPATGSDYCKRKCIFPCYFPDFFLSIIRERYFLLLYSQRGYRAQSINEQGRQGERGGSGSSTFTFLIMYPPAVSSGSSRSPCSRRRAHTARARAKQRDKHR